MNNKTVNARSSRLKFFVHYSIVLYFELVYMLLNIVTTAKIRPPVDRSMHMMIHEVLTAAWNWIFAKAWHCPVFDAILSIWTCFGPWFNPQIEYLVSNLKIIITPSKLKCFNFETRLSKIINRVLMLAIYLKTQRMIPAPRRKKQRQSLWLLIMGIELTQQLGWL